MNHRILGAFLAAATLLWPTSVGLAAAGQTGTPGIAQGTPQVTAPRLFERARKPFVSIFPVRPVRPSQERPAIPSVDPDMAPRIVCGMTVIPVSGEADPDMVQSPPRDPKVTYSLRIIKPPVCADK